jgi:hypothetical protein
MLVIAIATLLTSAVAHAAEPLRYTFATSKEPVYELSVRAEVPGGGVEDLQGRIAYTIVNTDPPSGRTTLTYTTTFRKLDGNGNVIPPAGTGRPRMGPPSWAEMFGGQQKPAAAQVVIDATGKVVQTNRLNDGDFLPYLVGPAWQLPFEELAADDRANWSTERDMNLYDKIEPKQDNRPPHFPRGPFDQPPPVERIYQTAREKVDYTRGAPTADGLVPVQRALTLTSTDQVDGKPKLQMVGDGAFQFDPAAGLLRSLNYKLTITFTEKNVTASIPVTVTAKLLSADEVAKIKADEAAAIAKAKADNEQRNAERMEKLQTSTDGLPVDATKTPMVGTVGGSPFTTVDDDVRPVIGFRYEPSTFGGRNCLKILKPIYERPDATGEDDGSADEGGSVLLAKPGYVVTGLTATSVQYLNAVRVTFMRVNDNGSAVPTDTYQSKWLGKSDAGAKTTELAGKGAIVIGLYGMQGLNLDGMGLVMLPAGTKLPPEAMASLTASDTETTPTGVNTTAAKPAPAINDDGSDADTDADPTPTAAAPAWQPRNGKTFEVLSKMTGLPARDGDDANRAVRLDRRGTLETKGKYRTPSAFRIVLRSDGHEVRLGYAADEVIFNWGMRPTELRIDGGPASGKHKPDAGALPQGRWTHIEWTVDADQMAIYVDGKLRTRVRADFSDVSKPFRLTATGGPIAVKSIEVVR